MRPSGGGRVVIVGASLAGATVAFTLCENGFDGEIVLVGAERELPYERPALSKSYLAGDVARDTLLVRPAESYDEHRIELRLGHAATAVDIERHTVTLDSGEVLTYSRLAIATGASNARPPIPGIDLAGVHQLRSVADAEALRDQLPGLRTAVVVGQGFIGCEITATLTTLGVAVTAIAPSPDPCGDRWEKSARSRSPSAVCSAGIWLTSSPAAPQPSALPRTEPINPQHSASRGLDPWTVA